MRRLLAAASIAAAVAVATGCGNDGSDGSDAPPQGAPATDNTAQVCAEAESVQAQQIQRFDQEITALQEQDLDQQEFEEAALESMERAVVGWSDGLQEQAQRAEDPELAEALDGLADGLAEAAPQLTVESVRTGEIPGGEELDSFGQTLTRLCTPAAPTTP